MDEFFYIIDENINPCRGCPDYESEYGCKSNGGCGKTQITNADRIRTLTDEELAKLVVKYGYQDEGWCSLPTCPPHDDCLQCALEWLRKPFKAKD